MSEQLSPAVRKALPFLVKKIYNEVTESDIRTDN